MDVFAISSVNLLPRIAPPPSCLIAFSWYTLFQDMTQHKRKDNIQIHSPLTAVVTVIEAGKEVVIPQNSDAMLNW